MSNISTGGPPAIGTEAEGNLGLARDSASYCCKFTALYDLLDNFTSPQVGATEVSISMRLAKSLRKSDKAKVPVYRNLGELLTLLGDGTGIANMSHALTIAASTKAVRRTDEIGRFGRALKHAPWHLGDDCFMMTVYAGDYNGVQTFFLAVALYSYTYQAQLAAGPAKRTELVKVICTWRRTNDIDRPWQRCDLPDQKFAQSWPAIRDHGPYGPNSTQSDSTSLSLGPESDDEVERVLLDDAQKTFWKSSLDSKPTTGTKMLIWNLHPDCESFDPKDCDSTYLKRSENDIELWTGGIGPATRPANRVDLPNGIRSQSLAKNLMMLYWRLPCRIKVQDRVVCDSQHTRQSSSIRSSSIPWWLLDVPKSADDNVIFQQIPINPRRSDQRVPGASGRFRQGQDFDCYIGKVKPSLGLTTKGLPKIWIWAQRRLIPRANLDSLLSATCREALTSSDGALTDFTVLLWLDDLAPSNIKESLALASTQLQHEWLRKALGHDGVISKFLIEQFGLPMLSTSKQGSMQGSKQRQTPKKRRSQAVRKNRASVPQDDSDASISDSEGGSRLSKRSRAPSASQAAASASQAAGSTANGAATMSQQSAPMYGVDSGSQPQASGQQSFGQNLAQEPAESMHTEVQDGAVMRQATDAHNTAGSEPFSRQEPVQQPQHQMQLQTQGRRHASSILEEAGGQPGTSTRLQQQLADQLRGVRLTAAGDQARQASDQSAGHSDPRQQSHGCPHPTPSLETGYFSAGSGISNEAGLASSVMTPMIETAVGVEASRDFTDDEVRKLNELNAKLQHDDAVPELYQYGEQEGDKEDADDECSKKIEFVKLTAETFVESMLDVFGDEQQTLACWVHPMMLLLEALAKDPIRAERLMAFDVETSALTARMSFYPQWCQSSMLSPRWQYGLVSVVRYDQQLGMAEVKATLLNSDEHINLVQTGGISTLSCNGQKVFQPPRSETRDRMLTSRQATASPSFEVVNRSNMSALTVTLKELMSTDALLLTFGNMNDEEALVRDSHKAATNGSRYQNELWPLKLASYNMMQACMRLKTAHNLKNNSEHMHTLSQSDAKKLRKGTLEDVHKHFVISTNRRFITPLPEDLGPLHTGCRDAAMTLEIILAMAWWWKECQGNFVCKRLLTSKTGRTAAAVGVHALQLSCSGHKQQYEARELAIAASKQTKKRSSYAGPQVTPEAVAMEPLQRRDPTKAYKDALSLHGYETLQKWAKEVEDKAMWRTG